MEQSKNNEKNFIEEFFEYIENEIDLQSADPRTGSNKQFSIYDLFIVFFGTFIFQAPSLRDYILKLKNGVLKNIFLKIKKIPSQTQLRYVLDHVNYKSLYKLFYYLINILNLAGKLCKYVFLKKYYLVAIDGSQATKSNKIKCPLCSTREHKSNGSVDYYHYVVPASIVSPPELDLSPLILPPEILTPQDGHDKQDCERAAAYRLLDNIYPFLESLGKEIILLADDLFCYDAFLKFINEHNNLNFIFNCKESSHKYLFSFIENIDIKTYIKKYRIDCNTKEIYKYEYEYNLPIKSDKKCCKSVDYKEQVTYVNLIKLTISLVDNEENLKLNEKGESQIKYFVFATNLIPTQENIEQLAAAGRSRWEIENRVFNILKNFGYHLTHSYGHGKKGLASLVITLIFLAYTLHTTIKLLFPELSQICSDKNLKLSIYFEIFDFLSKLESFGLLKIFVTIGLLNGNILHILTMNPP
jgi:hypothetical protein